MITHPAATIPAWRDGAPPTRLEAHYGDRVVRCFSERPASLTAMLADAVRANPTGEALICGERRYSWTQLAEQVGACAAGLAQRGIGVGDRVALLLGNRAEFVIALFAASRLGAIVVPLNIREQRPELEYVLNQCGAKLVVYEAELAERLPVPEQLTVPCRRVAMSGGEDNFAALLAAGPAPAPAAVNEEDTAVILYTSGTTGRPKGAMLSHLAIVHSSLHYQLAFGLTAVDRCVVAVPLSHVTGLVAMITAMVRAAGTLIILPAFKAVDFLALASRERMTYTLMVPAMYNLCLLSPDFEGCDLAAWRVGGYGGAPMPPATIERLAVRLPGLGLMNVYGATETTSPTTLMPAALTARHGDSVGLALHCAEIVVMDENGHAVAPGESGELWIRGPMVVSGYWDNPQATREAITGGFWHSGDIGSVDADGLVRVFDRKKDMINRGGYKVYTAEVEAVLAEHPAVVESAVIGKACPVLGERVHAFVTVRGEVTAAALTQFCAERLSDYKRPESYTLGGEPLPRNANGKVLKRQLRDQLPGG